MQNAADTALIRDSPYWTSKKVCLALADIIAVNA
jgi:hypothetical protein